MIGMRRPQRCRPALGCQPYATWPATIVCCDGESICIIRRRCAAPVGQEKPLLINAALERKFTMLTTINDVLR